MTLQNSIFNIDRIYYKNHFLRGHNSFLLNRQKIFRSMTQFSSSYAVSIRLLVDEPSQRAEPKNISSSHRTLASLSLHPLEKSQNCTRCCIEKFILIPKHFLKNHRPAKPGRADKHRLRSLVGINIQGYFRCREHRNTSPGKMQTLLKRIGHL